MMYTVILQYAQPSIFEYDDVVEANRHVAIFRNEMVARGYNPIATDDGYVFTDANKKPVASAQIKVS